MSEAECSSQEEAGVGAEQNVGVNLSAPPTADWVDIWSVLNACVALLHKRLDKSESQNQAWRQSMGDVLSQTQTPSGSQKCSFTQIADTDTATDSDSSVDYSDVKLNPKLAKSIQYMIVAIRDVLHIPETRVCMYKGKKPEVTFPPSHELNTLFERAWENPDKKLLIPKRISMAYTFPSEDRVRWESSPTVDKALARLSKKVVLPSPDTAVLKDPADRKQETTLKSIYVTMGMLLRPAVASAWVSSAIEKWADTLSSEIDTMDRDSVHLKLGHIRDAAVYLKEAARDIGLLGSRANAMAISARRALWTHQWNGDADSKKAM
ncbi:uncharacterized protein LOC134932047 [Pseudophryne corroboree]|uniref:uncharacterized protein LOC134932047 n=1 Tax=Pseudophryne corroboree TaxID=495146 RepID=UPI003081D0FC